MGGGAPARFFTLCFSVVGVAAMVMASLSPERLTRITTFIDPFKDYQDAGWQPAHGLFALSTGGLFGQGIGASQQKWGDLPEAHTDFIFAVLGEELGLAGTLLVIGLFLTIAFAALRVARHTADPFVRYATFGVIVWLLGQMIINVGMVLALLPVIGIPLPLVSYGGSALLPSLVALGMLVGFARREPEAARALAARAAEVRRALPRVAAADPRRPYARRGVRCVSSLGRTGPSFRFEGLATAEEGTVHDAHSPRRWRHRRPYLAPARDRRRVASSRSGR